MAFSRGPVIVRDGLVLHYDAANIKSFRGEPTTNVLTGIGYTFNNPTDNTFFKVNYGTETINIPALGTKSATYVNIFNDFNGGSGNCCPAPFIFGDFTVLPSTTYTYQIIYRTSTGYDHPNYMYQYQYNGGTYVTEFGLLSGDRKQSLGDGWIHGWGTFTTNASTNRIIAYLFHYEYGVWNKIQIAGIMLSQRATPLDPKFIIPPTASRGTTVATGGGVIDISNNNNSGELLGPVYESSNKGGFVFDGTDDTVTTPLTLSSLPALSNFSISCWVKINSFPSANKEGVLFGAAYYSGVALYWKGNSNGTAFNLHAFIRGNDAYRLTNGFSFSLNVFYHACLVNDYSNSRFRFYIDGNLIQDISGPTQEYNSGLATTAGNIGISKPQVDGGGEKIYSNFSGIVSMSLIHNRSLTATEVLQNYNAMKGRFK